MVSTGAIAGLCVAALLAISAPFIVYFVFRRRLTLSIRNILVGAACFILLAQGLELVLGAYLGLFDPERATWLRTHKIVLALYGALTAGVFEETARVIGFSFFVRKRDGAGTALAYGIGHGGAEAILVGAALLFQLPVIILLNQGKLDSLLGSRVSPAMLALIHSRFEHLTFVGSLAGGVERLSALTLQIGLSFLVWRAVTRREWGLFLLAILAHTALDVPAMLMQTGIIHLGTWRFEGAYAALAVVIAGILLSRLPPKRA